MQAALMLFSNLTDVDDVIAAFSVTQAKETTAGTLANVDADAASGTSVTGLYGTITIGSTGPTATSLIIPTALSKLLMKQTP